MGLKNISIAAFRAFLLYKGLTHVSTKGGHEKWSKKGIQRPVIFQTHIDPVPEFVIRKNLSAMECTRNELELWLNPHHKK